MITIAVGPFQWLVRLAAQMGIIVQKKPLCTKRNIKKKSLTIISLQFIWTKDPGASEPTTLWYLVGMKTFGKRMTNYR